MKSMKKMLMVIFLFVIGFSFVNVKAFNTNKNTYTDCVSADLSSYGAPNKTQICKLYSVTGDDTVPEDTIFCLEAAKDIVYAAYALQNTKNNGLACAVLDVINNSTLSSAIGINAYDWNGTTGSKIYIDSYDNINLTNFVTIQKYIWDHEKAGTGTCSAKNTESKTLTAGTLSTSASTVTLTKSGDNYVGSFTVSSSNLNNGYSYTANSSDVSLTKSGNTITITVPASKINGVKNYAITLQGSYNAKQTLTITPFVETYKCVVNEGTGCTNPDTHQSLGKIGFTRSISTTPATITKTVNVTAEPVPTLTLKKVDASGTVVNGATIKITKDGSAFKTETMTSGTLSITSGLSYGKYCVTEVTAPSGYIKTNISECVTLSATNPNGTITITNKKTQVTFSKTDAITGQALPGATLRILNSNKQAVGCSNCQWTSGTGPHTITGLPVGTYYLEEVAAPSGYVLIASSVKFTINSDGSVTSDSKSGSAIVMQNIKISTSFLKIDAGTDKPLAGATLQILDKDKNPILNTDGSVKYEWVSTTEAHIIDGLPAGTYYLKEVSAPEGYSLNSELIEFTINTDGSVNVKDQKDEETAVIIMENKKTVTSFSKQDATTGKELPGATLQILDKNKKPITDEKGNVLYKWVSTDKPYVIEGLPVGIYYLKETIQPKGYELNEELVKFEVKADGTVTKVIMKNTPIVEVPDTASTKSIILIVLGSLLGLAGIGLIVYTIIRKKNSKI